MKSISKHSSSYSEDIKFMYREHKPILFNNLIDLELLNINVNHEAGKLATCVKSLLDIRRNTNTNPNRV